MHNDIYLMKCHPDKLSTAVYIHYRLYTQILLHSLPTVVCNDSLRSNRSCLISKSSMTASNMKSASLTVSSKRLKHNTWP